MQRIHINLTTDLAVSPEAELTTRKDHVVNERTGAEHGGEFKGIKRCEQRLDQALLEFTALSTLTAERSSLPSISETDPVSDSTSLNVVLPAPSFPTQPISTHTVSSIRTNTTMSMTVTPKNAGVSTTSRSTNNNGLSNALAGASNIGSAVSHPLGSTVHTPVYSMSTVVDASITRPPVSVAQRHWIPRPFISDIRSIAHRSLWPVLATSKSPTRNEDNHCNGDGNEELD
ncbi:hypothetical protein PQX77_001199 [Marasmius sp. AFHP31]|nr:hypothetical protein PQX77_001199 [Marasmius sp. AFHP31]